MSLDACWIFSLTLLLKELLFCYFFMIAKDTGLSDNCGYVRVENILPSLFKAVDRGEDGRQWMIIYTFDVE